MGRRGACPHSLPNDSGRRRFIDYTTQAYLIIVALLILLGHNETVSGWGWLLLAHVAGVVIIHGLVAGHAAWPENRPLLFLRDFYPIIMYAGFYRETSLLNRMIVPDYLDGWFMRLEETLCGCQPSLAFMAKLPYLPVSELFYAAYFSYYVMIVGVAVALYRQGRERFLHYVSIVSFVFYVCYLIYILLPVVGPALFYAPVPDFPGQAALPGYPVPYPPDVTKGLFFGIMKVIYAHFEGHGAAFPSSHVAVALVTLCFSWRYLRPIRYVHLGAVILLCFATVYCRYHYAVDVPAGALTGAALLLLGERLYRRFG